MVPCRGPGVYCGRGLGLKVGGDVKETPGTKPGLAETEDRPDGTLGTRGPGFPKIVIKNSLSKVLGWGCLCPLCHLA